ncbi:MAG: hypothetical protein ACYC33_11905 [Thermoleophilia bacterium]
MPVHQQLMGTLWGVGLGLGLIVVIWLVVSNAWFRAATGDEVPEGDVTPDPVGMVDEYPEELKEAHGKPTLFLKLWIVAFVLWAIGYVVIFLLQQSA